MSDNCTVAPANGRITGTQIRIVAVVVLGAFLALLNQTVMSPALPVIMSDFAIDASTAQWIMSIYPLVSGIMVPVSAFLIDKFSTRALFFGATLVFALGTLLCAAAPDFLFLIIGRVLQAAGSGVLMPLVSVVPMLVFPVEKRGTAMGMAGIVMSAGPAVGPVVGGAVIDTYGWRTMIGAIVPLAILVLVLGVFMLKNVGELKNPKLDLPSVVLSTIAFGGLLYGFSSASSMGWGNPVVLGSIVAGVVCLVLFVVRQGKIEDPLLQLGTLKTREFRVAAIIVTLINAACLVTNTLLPLLLQTSLGASAFETGIGMPGHQHHFAHFTADCDGRDGAADGHGDASRRRGRHPYQPHLGRGVRQVRSACHLDRRPGPHDRRPVPALAFDGKHAHLGGCAVLHAAVRRPVAREHAGEHMGCQCLEK